MHIDTFILTYILFHVYVSFGGCVNERFVYMTVSSNFFFFILYNYLHVKIQSQGCLTRFAERGNC